jgi:hypothetical protein
MNGRWSSGAIHSPPPSSIYHAARMVFLHTFMPTPSAPVLLAFSQMAKRAKELGRDGVDANDLAHLPRKRTVRCVVSRPFCVCLYCSCVRLCDGATVHVCLCVCVCLRPSGFMLSSCVHAAACIRIRCVGSAGGLLAGGLLSWVLVV